MQPIKPESVIRATRTPPIVSSMAQRSSSTRIMASCLTLNAVGTHLWGLLGEVTVAELATAVTKEFEVAFEPALQDTWPSSVPCQKGACW